MDRKETKEFISFIEVCSWEELLGRQKRIIELKSMMANSESIADMKFFLKLIDQEIAARYEVEAVVDKESNTAKPSG